MVICLSQMIQKSSGIIIWSFAEKLVITDDIYRKINLVDRRLRYVEIGLNLLENKQRRP